MQSYQRYAEDEAAEVLVEVDPLSGKEQRASVPAWFEDLPPGATVSWVESRLLPLPAGVKSSPLGSRDGLIGWKVLTRRDGNITGMGIDGRSITLTDFADRPQIHSRIPLAMMDQPAGDAYWVFTDSGLVIDSQTGNAIADFRGMRTAYGEGQPSRIPVDFLHLMQVRHLASSKKLRQLTRAQAKTLLAAGAVEHEARKKKETEGDPDREAASTAVSKLLPKAPPSMVTGIARIARIAAEEQIALVKLRTLDPSEIKPVGDEPAAQARVSRVAEGLSQLEIPHPTSTYYYGQRADANAQQHLEDVLQFLTGKSEGPITGCNLSWLSFWKDVASISWRCFWRLATVEDQFTTVKDRVCQPWLETLSLIADSKVLDLPGKFRLYLCTDTDQDAVKSAIAGTRGSKNVKAWSQGQSRYVAQFLTAYPRNIAHILEYSDDGTMRPPTEYVVNDSQDVHHRWSSEQLCAFIAAVREMEQLPLATSEQLETAAAQLQVSPIEVAVVWMGNLRTVHYGNDKLTKELRSHYGWKVKPVQEAITSLDANALSWDVVGAPMRKDPAAVFGAGQPQAFDALVTQWKKERGSSLRLSPELVTLLEKAGGLRNCVSAIATLLGDGPKAEMLQRRKFSFASRPANVVIDLSKCVSNRPSRSTTMRF